MDLSALSARTPASVATREGDDDGQSADTEADGAADTDGANRRAVDTDGDADTDGAKRRADDADDHLGGDEAGRWAAVLAPVVVRDGDPHVLFTKRADHLGDHPGQMSFPGGGREPYDDDLRATALRECREEIGLAAEEAEVVGRLDDIRTVTGYAVRPFVGRIPDRTYEPDGVEVAEIAVLAVDDLTDPANYESERREHPHRGDVRLHFFHVDGYTVWGATGRMLVQLLELTTDWRAPAEVDRVVDPDADLPT